MGKEKREKLKIIPKVYNQEKEFIKNIFGKLPARARAKLCTNDASVVEDDFCDHELESGFLSRNKKVKSLTCPAQSGSNLSHQVLSRQRQPHHFDLYGKERVDNANAITTNTKSICRKVKRNKTEKGKAEIAQEKRRHKTSQKFRGILSSTRVLTSSDNDTDSSRTTASSSTASSFQKTILQRKPVLNAEGKVVFSKFDFITSFNQSPPKHHAGSNSHSQKGTKVGDDPTLLKKSLKKQNKIKAKQKNWRDHTAHQEQQIKQQLATNARDTSQARTKKKDEKSKRIKKNKVKHKEVR